MDHHLISFFSFKLLGCHEILLEQKIWIVLIAYVFIFREGVLFLNSFLSKRYFLRTTWYDVFCFILSHSCFCLFILYKLVRFTRSMSKRENKAIRVGLSDNRILSKNPGGPKKWWVHFFVRIFCFFLIFFSQKMDKISISTESIVNLCADKVPFQQEEDKNAKNRWVI